MATGRNRKKKGVAVAGTWVPLGLTFLRSRACASLSPHGAKLLLDLLALLGPNAANNGDLSITPKTMMARGWPGRETLRAEVSELEEQGLLAKTKQGGRLDCNLFALTLYPLDCDPKKLDIGPGTYTSRDWEIAGLGSPTEDAPATWRRARKTVSLASSRDEVPKKRPATGRQRAPATAKRATSSRHGTKTPVFDPSSVPLRGTFLDKPSIGASSDAPGKGLKPAGGPPKPTMKGRS